MAGTTKSEMENRAADYEAKAAAELNNVALMASVFGTAAEVTKQAEALRDEYKAAARRYRWLASLHPATRAKMLREAV